MSHKTRKAYTAEEKVAILRRHLLEQTPVSDLCDQYQLHPTQFYRWRGSSSNGTVNAAKPSSLLDNLTSNEIGYGTWKPLKSEDSASTEKNRL